MFNRADPTHVALQRSTEGGLRPASLLTNTVDVALHEGGFTLAELLVSIAALVLLVFLFTQLLSSAGNYYDPR